MNDSKKKCTSKEHGNIEANSYCHECKIYICKKCENIHSILFQNHHVSKTSDDLNQIFTGICKVEQHSEKLKYFCKTHNVLCCAQCITKIKDDENGQHKDCSICLIDDIKDVKKNNLSDNLKSLENFSLSLQDSIKEIKIIFEKINENKENIKTKIQQIFTKIRNQVNKREDEILLKVDEKFDTLFFKEDMVKDFDKLPNKIEMSLQKGKIISDSWNDQNKINSLINDCINIENNTKYINDLYSIMRKCKSINLKVEFIPEKRGISSLKKAIKSFGGIKFNNFKFKKCPKKINENREYEVSGEDENILTKTGTDEEWMGTICENKLDKSKECIWEIKVLKTEENKIMVGVASEDFDINSSLYDNCGWYYYLYDDSLISESKSNKQDSKDQTKYNDFEEEREEERRYSLINNKDVNENLNSTNKRNKMNEMISKKDNYYLNNKNIMMGNQQMNNSYSEYQFQPISIMNQNYVTSRPVKMNRNEMNLNSENQFQTINRSNQNILNSRPVYQVQKKNKMIQKELYSKQVYPIQATSIMNKIDYNSNSNSEYQFQEINEIKMDKKEKDSDSDSKYKKKSKKEKEKDSDSDSKYKKKSKKKKEESSDSDSKYKKKSKKKKEESSDSECDKKKYESSDSDSECEKKEKENSDSISEYKNEEKERSDSEEEDKSEPDKKKKKKKISISEEDSEENERNEDKKLEIKKVTQEITMILNFEKKSLKFLKNNEIKGELSDINIDKPLFPAVFLYNTDDCIKIEGFC